MRYAPECHCRARAVKDKSDFFAQFDVQLFKNIETDALDKFVHTIEKIGKKVIRELFSEPV